MTDSQNPKIKPKTVVLNSTVPADLERKVPISKTTILRPIPLIDIEKALETAERLLKSEQILEALNEYEQIFIKFQLDLPPAAFAQRFSEIFRKIAVIAIGFLNSSQKDQCFSLLNRCEKILEDGQFGHFPELNTLIYNHLGCYYRRIEKIDVALNYYTKSLAMIQKHDRKKNAGLTHMNLSAIYSQIQRFASSFYSENGFFN